MSLFQSLASARLGLAAVPALLALLTALFFWRLTVLGEALYWGTPLLQFFPWRTLAVQEYLSGRVPLWNPYLGFGAPLAANLQSGVFYPLNLVYFFLPIERAMTATVLLHVFLAGWFTYEYCRRVRLSRSGASLAALAFMFSGFLIARAGFLSITSTVSWLPALFAAVEACTRGGSRADGSRRALWAAALAGATGMVLLAGHIQLAYYSLVATVGYLLWRTLLDGELPPWRSAQRWATALRIAAPALAGLALGVGLAAIQLLTSWELVGQSIRQNGMAYQDATSFSLWPGQLLGVVAPNFYGSQAAGDWWGPGAYWEGVIYVGVLPLLLAGLGVRYAQSSLSMFFAILAAIALFLAMGHYNPLFEPLFQRIPGLSLFQAPARFGLWYTFGVAVLAGLGWESLHADASRGKGLGVLALVLGAGLLLGVNALSLAGPALARAAPALSAFATAGTWLLAAGLLLAWRSRAKPLLWRAGALSLVVSDLFLFGVTLNPTTDPRLYTKESPASAQALWEVAGLDRTYVTQASYQESIDRFFSFKGPFVTRREELWQLRETLLPNLASTARLYEVYNYDPLRLDRPWRLQQAAEEQGLPSTFLDMMGVRFLLGHQEAASDGQRWRDDLPAIVYERPPPLPRAFIVPEAILVPDKETAMARLLAEEFDPRRQAVVEAPQAIAIPTGAARGGARVLEHTAHRVVVETTSGGGVLVVADTYYPGWRARVDGQEATIWPTNVAFRGIPLPLGDHRVELSYEPASFTMGAAVSALALLGVTALAGYGLWRRRSLTARG